MSERWADLAFYSALLLAILFMMMIAAVVAIVIWNWIAIERRRRE